MEREPILITGTSNPDLARKVGMYMEPPITVYNATHRFPDGETRGQIPVNVRRRPVFIIQSTCPPNVDRALTELNVMIDAAKRASADEVTVLIPYFGFGRQDRRDPKLRTSITAALTTSAIQAAGADRIITLDLHSTPTTGAMKNPWENLYGSYTLIPVIRALDLHNPVVVSPDSGGFPRALHFSEGLDLGEDVAIVFKRRNPKTGQPKIIQMVGDVANRDVLLIDDIGDTLKTLTQAANYLKKQGAGTIYAAVTHGIFSGSALSRLRSSAISQLFMTDTIPARQTVLENPKIHIVSVAPLLAKVIAYTLSGQSIGADLMR